MRFLHTADLHLGAAPDKDRPWGPARADAVRTSLLRFTEICRQEDIDLMLIAGDLFDAPPLLQELKDVNFLFSQLPHTKVVLIAGNHDFLHPGSAYEHFRFAENVFFLTSPEPDSVFFPQWNLEVHGMSYDAREIPEARLNGLKAPRDGRRHFLLAHGGDEKHVPIRVSALTAAGWDYIAMGHLHKPAITSDGRLAFPGSPEPLDSSETGEHGYYIGEIRPDRFSVSWHRFSDFEYTPLTVNMTPDMSFSELELLIRKRLAANEHEVLNLKLAGRRDPDLIPDIAALERLDRIASVKDESLPDYPFEEWMTRPEHDLLASYVRELSGENAGETEKKALYMGLDALLGSGKKPGEEALR